MQAPDAIIFADREGLIRVWNRGAEPLFGHAAEEVIGCSLDIIIPERLRRAHWAASRRAFDRPDQIRGRARTTRATHKNGGKLYVDLSFGPITDAAGTVPVRWPWAVIAASVTCRRRRCEIDSQRSRRCRRRDYRHSRPFSTHGRFRSAVGDALGMPRRIERQCSTLRRLVPHWPATAPTARRAPRGQRDALLRYVRAASSCRRGARPLSCAHRGDGRLGSGLPARADRRPGGRASRARSRLAALRTVLEQVVAGDCVSLEPDDVEAFVSLYERHIEREESELLPMAARLLSVEDLDRVGRAMRERRGIDPVGDQ